LFQIYYKSIEKRNKSSYNIASDWKKLAERGMENMRKLIAGVMMLAVLACVFMPEASFTEDRDTVLLAKTIYALGRNESFETKLALGNVVTNRMANPWFKGDLGEVLEDQQQFPAGSRYDEESLRAAHEVLTGRQVISEYALYYQAADSISSWGEANLIESVGNYNFYSASGNL